MRLQFGALGLAIVCASGLLASAEDAHSAVLDRTFAVAQAMIPPTGMGPADKAMAAQDMAETERMQRRFPQPVRVGDLIGLPVLDDDNRTLGHVRQVVRTPQGKIKLIVAYGGFLGSGYATCRGADRGGGNFWAATRFARYAAAGLCRRADMAGHRRCCGAER